MLISRQQHSNSVASNGGDNNGIKRMYPEVEKRINLVNRLSILTCFVFFIICVIQLSSIEERIIASNYVVSEQFRNIAAQLYPALYSTFAILLFFSLTIPLCGLVGTKNKDKSLLNWFCIMNSCCFIVAAFSFGQVIYLGDLCSDAYKNLPNSKSSCSSLYFVYYISCILLAILLGLFFISAYSSYKLYSHPKLTVLIMEVHHHHTPAIGTQPQNQQQQQQQPSVEIGNRRIEKRDDYVPLAIPINN